MVKIEIDNEELQAVITFQKDMIEGALDSCEYVEAEVRKSRVEELEKILRAAR